MRFVKRNQVPNTITKKCIKLFGYCNMPTRVFKSLSVKLGFKVIQGGSNVKDVLLILFEDVILGSGDHWVSGGGKVLSKWITTRDIVLATSR